MRGGGRWAAQRQVRAAVDALVVLDERFNRHLGVEHGPRGGGNVDYRHLGGGEDFFWSVVWLDKKTPSESLVRWTRKLRRSLW